MLLFVSCGSKRTIKWNLAQKDIQQQPIAAVGTVVFSCRHCPWGYGKILVI